MNIGPYINTHMNVLIYLHTRAHTYIIYINKVYKEIDDSRVRERGSD